MSTVIERGVDVSSWQGSSINWAQVKTQGISFAIIRAGFGALDNQKDNAFEVNYTGARAAGMKLGTYWYSYATTVERAKQEAATCLKTLAGKKFDLPVYFDQEYEPGILALNNAQRTAICKAFCEEIKKAGYVPGVYASKDFFESKLNYKELECYDIWVAQYASACTYKGKYNMWQNTSSGSVTGIPGKVDMNYRYTTVAEAAPAPVYSFTDFVREVQAAIGAKVDGVAGSETLSRTVTVSRRRNATHAVVRPLQKWLYALGYTQVGTADGVAGAKFDAAVKAYQKANGCVADGEITAKMSTWKKLLKLA